MTALVVIGGWGLPVDVMAPLTEQWRGDRLLFGLDQSLSAAPGSPEAFVDSLLAQVPSDAVWLGWSLGGELAMLAAARAPTPPKGIVTLGSTPSFVEHADWPQGMPQGQFDAFVQGMRDNPERQWRRFLLLQIRGDADESRARQSLMPWLEEGLPTEESSLLSTLEWLELLDLRGIWRDPPCPALHMLGANDPLVDAAVADYTGGASVAYRVPGMAHWPHASYHEAIWQKIQESLSAWA